ncbi:hypothetical protein PIROE2DRAFT_3432 [Piromyces sp. E2]|nr:hypothetical protein PIROE2DRAFT_3432 [Piromyces sp. E2]|eukprot:OUM68747.1 hypothetical protein PIROE2DRAFT_3432 [Piromyces sp. E2]
MNIVIYYYIFLSVIKFCFGNYYNNCKIIGDSNSFPIYVDNKNPSFTSKYGYIKIDNEDFNFGYCECFTENGNCLLEFNLETNSVFHKIVIEFEYQKNLTLLAKDHFNYEHEIKTNLERPTVEDIHKDYISYINKKAETEFIDINLIRAIQNHKANPSKDTFLINLYSISKIANLNNKDLNEKKYNIASSLDTVIEEYEKEQRMYYLTYSPNIQFEYIKSDKYFFYNFGGFKIRRILSCNSDTINFNSEKTNRKDYTLKGYTPLEINCTWGNPDFILNDERYDLENFGFFNSISNKLIFLISFIKIKEITI